MIKKATSIIILFLVSIVALKSQPYKVHSHNDYRQSVPFWKAYSVGVASIEVDVFLEKGALLVAHDKEELPTARTLEELYLTPLAKAIELGLVPESLQLLIDVKSEAYGTLDAIVKSLEKHFSTIINSPIQIVISGNRPQKSDFVNYPHFIYFDYQSLKPIANLEILDKIALVSMNFRNYTQWNGLGRLTREDLLKVRKVVDSAHALGKPFRFWASPDSKTAWKAMTTIGVDFINTDKPFECNEYLTSLESRIYRNEETVAVYKPLFKIDGSTKAPQNIILLIGDGNGLAQISATAIANGGELSLTQLKNIGFLITNSSDDLTTDSAAGATAMATGKKVPNRAIGVDHLGNAIPNITEILNEKGYNIGLITSDEITGATPASFYAHQMDRSMTEEILIDFKNSAVDVFVAASGPQVENRNQFAGFDIVSSLEDLPKQNRENSGFLFSYNNSPAPLSTAFLNVVENLQSRKKPFFLMVEGAKIDSHGHGNNISGIIKEGLAFDKVVSEAIKFADINQNTLVLITADHETGGLSLPQGNLAEKKVEADFTTNDHTAIMIPIFAYGPGAQNFQGVYNNNELFHKIMNAIH